MKLRHLCVIAAAAAALVLASAPASAARAPTSPTPREASAPDGSGSRGERAAAGTERKEKKPERLRVGPLVGLGFPRPIVVGVFAKVHRIVGFGAEYSSLPPMNVFGADTRFEALAVDLRVFPFKNAFFVGMRAGRQWLSARARISVQRYGSFTESMDAATWFINPRAGFLHTFGSGITIGLDAGIQLPIAPSYERNGLATRAGLASEVEADSIVATVADLLGNSPTPTVDFLRSGILF